MILPLWYAVLFGVGIIAVPIILAICIKLYPPPKYSILRRTISGLGEPPHRGYKLFNPMMVTMGIFVLPLPYFLLQVLPPSWLAYVGIVILFAVPFGIIMVGLFHAGKPTGHMIGALSAFGGALIANVFLFYPFLISPLSIIISIMQLELFGICVPLFYAFFKHFPVYEPDVPIEKISHNLNLWEWSAFLSLLAWIIAVYINLLIL
jgi:hypothetical membrane protein